jgi:hypothetical protein
MTAHTEATPRRRPGSTLLGFGLVLATGVIGYLLGSQRTPADAHLANLSPASSQSPGAKEFEELRSELRELRDQLQQRDAPVGGGRVPAGTPDDRLSRLLSAIEKLDAQTSRLEGGGVQAAKQPPNPQLLPSLAVEAKASLLRPSEQDDSSTAFNDWSEARSKELHEVHLLWTIDDIVAAYGRPSKVEEVSGQLVLRYDIVPLDNEREAEIAFWTLATRVIHTSVSWHGR